MCMCVEEEVVGGHVALMPLAPSTGTDLINSNILTSFSLRLSVGLIFVCRYILFVVALLMIFIAELFALKIIFAAQ